MKLILWYAICCCVCSCIAAHNLRLIWLQSISATSLSRSVVSIFPSIRLVTHLSCIVYTSCTMSVFRSLYAASFQIVDRTALGRTMTRVVTVLPSVTTFHVDLCSRNPATSPRLTSSTTRSPGTDFSWLPTYLPNILSNLNYTEKLSWNYIIRVLMNSHWNELSTVSYLLYIYSVFKVHVYVFKSFFPKEWIWNV